MNNTVKKHWKDWLILLLVVMNLTALSGKLFSYAQPVSEETIIVDQTSAPINGSCMIENLGLDQEQQQAFRTINQQFRQGVRSLLIQIDEQRNSMFTELQQPESDTLRLQAISRNIGELHRKLKDETNRFYLSVKAICRAEQVEKLQHCFTPLFENRCCPRTGNCKTDCRHSRHKQKNQ